MQAIHAQLEMLSAVLQCASQLSSASQKLDTSDQQSSCLVKAQRPPQTT
jgi:hypothetical protein